MGIHEQDRVCGGPDKYVKPQDEHIRVYIPERCL